MFEPEVWILALLYGTFVFSVWAIVWTLDEELVRYILRGAAKRLKIWKHMCTESKIRSGRASTANYD